MTRVFWAQGDEDPDAQPSDDPGYPRTLRTRFYPDTYPDTPQVLVFTLNPRYYGLPQRMRHHHIRYRRKWAKR